MRFFRLRTTTWTVKRTCLNCVVRPKSHLAQANYQECFKILGLSSHSDEEQVRTAFIKLAKRFHPDSQHEDADAVKFAEIENAYRKLQEKFANERRSVNDGAGEYGLYHADVICKRTDQEDYDIEHTAPQHRQFLSHEGIGLGTPFQREKQYQQYKVLKAVENVYNKRVSHSSADENSLIVKNIKASKKVQSRYGIDRLVEDLIQESMAKGEFSNLKGTGKPLEFQNHNPFIDVVTHKVNQVLIENGFSPQWVTLEKEIRSEIQELKNKLMDKRTQLGPSPLSPSDEIAWSKHVDALKEDVQSLNKKIDNFNLVVPLLNKQKVHINLSRLASKILAEVPCRTTPNSVVERIVPNQPQAVETSSNSSLFGMISLIWK